MCGRFTITVSVKEIINRFEIQQFVQEQLFSPSFNVAPGQKILAVINDGSKNRLGYLKWGLVPPWAKDEKIGYKMINARAETLADKPSFRHALKKRRCLIVADSFYDWKLQDPDTKVPMRIKMKSNELFAMAGLWESWKSANGKIVYSCTIITTEANELMKDIHDRMPVILKKEDEERWLDPSISDTAILMKILKPYDAEKMEAYEVSTDINSAKNNFPELIQRV
ncbi:SOS response-associated peptidase [Bacillaceae bacterium Marseille-Q3522]|nr:SOS response-associated peptidase [Bacillaceae bacterium Marseille-Q3522]